MKIRGRQLIALSMLFLASSLPLHGDDGVKLHIAGSQNPDIIMTNGSILTFSPSGLTVTNQDYQVGQSSFGEITLGPARDVIKTVVPPGDPSTPSGDPIVVPIKLDTVIITYPDPVVISVIPTQKDISAATIVVSGTYYYTGYQHNPLYVVSYNGTELTEGTDYTAVITNNLNVGTATITVTGKGDYTGTKTATFAIRPVTLTVTADDKTMVYGEAKPELSYKISGFVANEDETVLAKKPIAETDPTTVTNVGEYDIIVSGGEARNYDFSYVSAKLTVTPRDLSGAILSFADSCVYTGKEIKPVPTVKLDTLELTETTDYELSYSNNVEPGTATMTVTGIGNYTGQIDTTFVIYLVQTTEVRINGVFIEGTPDADDSKKLTFESPWGVAVVNNAFAPALNKATLTVTATDTTLISSIYRNVTTLVFPEHEEDEPVKTYEGSYYIPLSGKVVIDVTFVTDTVAVGIHDLEEFEISYSVYDTRGQKVDSGKAYSRQEVLDRIKRQPQGLYIIKENNKTYKVYRK